MATKQKARVALTREHRDAIYEHIETVIGTGTELDKYLADAEFDQTDREWLTTFGWKLSVCCRLLDQIGWQKRGDHINHELEVDQDAARFMEYLEREARATLRDDSVNMAKEREALARQGVTFTDDEWTEQLRDHQWWIDCDLDALDAARIALAAYRKAVS